MESWHVSNSTLKGDYKTFNTTGISGKVYKVLIRLVSDSIILGLLQAVRRHFCPKCGSQIANFLDAAPESAFIKAGTLSDAIQEVSHTIDYCTRILPCNSQSGDSEARIWSGCSPNFYFIPLVLLRLLPDRYSLTVACPTSKNDMELSLRLIVLRRQLNM